MTDTPHKPTDEEVLAHMQRRGQWGTIRKVWRFATEPVYQSVLRLWWRGQVEIRWRTLEARAIKRDGGAND
jgi:hypothetical protein